MSCRWPSSITLSYHSLYSNTETIIEAVITFALALIHQICLRARLANQIHKNWLGLLLLDELDREANAFGAEMRSP